MRGSRDLSLGSCCWSPKNPGMQGFASQVPRQPTHGFRVSFPTEASGRQLPQPGLPAPSPSLCRRWEHKGQPLEIRVGSRPPHSFPPPPCLPPPFPVHRAVRKNASPTDKEQTGRRLGTPLPYRPSRPWGLGVQGGKAGWLPTPLGSGLPSAPSLAPSPSSCGPWGLSETEGFPGTHLCAKTWADGHPPGCT